MGLLIRGIFRGILLYLCVNYTYKCHCEIWEAGNSDNLRILHHRHKRQNPPQHFLHRTQYPDSKAGPNCGLVFNEFKQPYGCGPAMHFLELRKICEGRRYPRPGPLEDFRILHMTCNLEGEIYSYGKLGNHKLVKAASGVLLFVIGATGLQQSSLAFSHADFQYAGADENQVFALRGDGPNMLLLVHGSERHFSAFRLPEDRERPGHFSPLTLTEDLRNRLKSRGTIKDALIFGPNPAQHECPLFYEIFGDEDITGEQRWGNRKLTVGLPHHVHSINRCMQHIHPFDPYLWKSGPPTPLMDNVCNPMLPFLNTDVPVVIVPQEGMEIEQPPAAITKCPAQHRNLNSKLAKYMPDLNTLNRLAVQHQPPNPYLWELPLDTEVEENILSHQANLFDIHALHDPKVAYWLEMVKGPTAATGKEARYKCKICNAFAEEQNRLDRPSSKLRTPLMKPEGVLYQDRLKNTKAIQDHTKELMHIDAEDYVKQCVGVIDDVSYNQPLETAVRQLHPPQERFYVATNNYFKAAMQFIHSNSPFNQFKGIMNQFLFSGGLVGRFFHTRKGLVQVLKSVSDDIHTKLLSEINEKNNPISILSDGYQDKRGRHILGIAVMCWVAGEPKLVSYRLKMMGARHDAESTFNVILEALIEDGIADNVKKNLVAYISDGASVNRGDYNSIKTKFRDWTGRSIVYIWCYAHRIQLVWKGAVRDGSAFHIKRVISIAKWLTTFFGAKTIERQLLLDDAELSGINPVVLTQINFIRWAHSVRAALQNIYNLYPCSIRRLRARAADPATDAAKKRDIDNQIAGLTTNHFPATLAYTIDMFEVLDTYSLLAQRASSTILNIGSFRQDLIANVRRLRDHSGRTMVRFLTIDTTWTEQRSSNAAENLRGYENSPFTSFKGVALTTDTTSGGQNPESVLRTSKTRQNFGDKVIERIGHYFGAPEGRTFNLFNPEVFVEVGTNEAGFNRAVRDDFLILLRDLGYNNEVAAKLFVDWKALACRIIDQPGFLGRENQPPQEFWKAKINDATLQWPDDVKLLMRKLLVIPSGSVELEREFSVVTYTLNKHRLRMKVSTAEQVLRIKRNIPKDVRNWDSHPFVKEWLAKDKSRVDDDKNRRYKSMLSTEGQRVEPEMADENLLNDDAGIAFEENEEQFDEDDEDDFLLVEENGNVHIDDAVELGAQNLPDAHANFIDEDQLFLPDVALNLELD